MSSPVKSCAVARTLPEPLTRHSALDATAKVAATPTPAGPSSPSASPSTSAGYTTNDRSNSHSNDSSASVEELQHVNRKLHQSVELLQNAIVRLGDDSKQQLEAMSTQLEQLLAVNERLRRENDALKGRVADDVLRQRQTNRIEMAVERAKAASLVRLAGRRRLESMEAVLMEAHDDLFHVQRFDAALAPQREVSFVFHYVSNVVFPLAGAEQFVMNVYQQILRSTAQRLRGYTISSCMGLDVFAFQSATTALQFARDCHEQVVRLGWPEQTERVPFFSTVTEFGYVLFRGPRIHTCIYTCDPETEVSPATGRTIYFGNDVKLAVDAALSVSAVGEIAVNDRCCDVLIREHRVLTDSAEPKLADTVDGLRQSLGKNWDVVRLPNTHKMVASLLPLSLKGRRGVDVVQLSPTPKYPIMDGIDPQATALAVIKTFKGQKVDVVEMHGGRKRVARFVESTAEPDHNVYDSAAKLLEFYTMQRERDNVVALYRRTEQSAAGLERAIMESEDRYEVSRRKPLDPSETAFVCTVDTGDESVWDKVLASAAMRGERDEVHGLVRGAVHTLARQYYGFLMNGNYVDIFTYVFREVEQALAFVSGVYIQINRLGTKLTGQEVYLMRAGISCGPMSTIYRHMEDGLLKCTGPVIRLSATLSDLAQNGEILAMEDVIQEFYKKNENLMDMQYNMVRQQSRFIGVCDTPSIVHSILPRPFAFRRQQLMNSAAAPRTRTGRSAKAVLAVHQKQFGRRDVEKLLSDQLARLEGLEASRMASEDTFEQSQSALVAVVRNPWLFTSQPQVEHVRQPKPGDEPLSLAPPPPTSTAVIGTLGEPAGGSSSSSRRGAGLGFLFCDVAGTALIERALSEDVFEAVYQHYNSILQDILRKCDAFIVKTSGVSGYVAAFYPPIKALEAAVSIQQRLLATAWPVDLSTLEPTLLVKDARTGTVLFSGLRAQVAVHYSTHYKWRPLPPPPPSQPASAAVGTAVAGVPGDRQAGSTSTRASSRRGPASAAPQSKSNASAAARGFAKEARGRSGAGGSAATRQRSTPATAMASSLKGDPRSIGTVNGEAQDASQVSPVDADTVISYIEVSSTAMSELAYLGRLAHGGEIRMSLPFVDRVRRTTAGRLLLEQLIMRIVVPNVAPSALTGQRERSTADTSKRGALEEGSAAERPQGRRRTLSLAGADSGEADDDASGAVVATGGEIEQPSHDGRARQADSPPRRRSRSSLVAHSTNSQAPNESPTNAPSSATTASNEVVVSRWIVAVLRSLEGRFPFLLPMPDTRSTAGATTASPTTTATSTAAAGTAQSGVAGSAATTGPAGTAATLTSEALARNVKALSTKSTQNNKNSGTAKDLVASTGNENGASAGDDAQGQPPRARATSAHSTRSTTVGRARETDARRSSAVPSAAPSHTRDAPWFLTTESCTLPLPAAARGAWDQPQIVSRSGHPEAETVQNALEYVLKLFPADLQENNAVSRLVAAAETNLSPVTAASPSLAESTQSPLTLAVGGGGYASGLTSGGSSPSTLLLERAQQQQQMSGVSADDKLPPEAAALQERKRRVDAARHYVQWMRVARHVLDCVLLGFRIGNDGVKPVKIGKGTSAAAVNGGSMRALGLMTDDENSEDFEKSVNMPGDTLNATLSAGVRTATLNDTLAHGTSGGHEAGSGGGDVSNGGYAASPSSSALHPANTSPSTTLRSALFTPPSGAVTVGGTGFPPLPGLSLVGPRTGSNDGYRRALDNLDDACRALTDEVGRALGKVAPPPPGVPQAPKNVTKKSTTPPRRRF